MLILQFVGGTIFSCILMSFIEHQVHSRLMHRSNFLSKRLAGFKKTFEAHAIFHHGHYSKIFCDEPVPEGEDKEIQLTVRKAPMKALPFSLVLALFSWPTAIMFIATVVFHHWTWNKIHLEMHKPEARGFSNWTIYKYLAGYHYLHHKHPDKNFNVVFPFADFILGTHVKPNDKELREIAELGLLTPGQKVRFAKLPKLEVAEEKEAVASR